MSRAYSMSVEIKKFDKSKIVAIQEAADEVWTWEEWSGTMLDNHDILYSYGDSNLCAGETEDEFAVRLTKAIWKANGGYCEVNVNQTCLEDLPCESYTLSEEDYKKSMAE